jgi:DNA-binding response OmpR family regulator
MTGKTILLVDDDQDLLLGLTPRLKANGYKVVYAKDAIAAIAVARTEAADLVILDLGLPAGDGFVVLERMRALKDLVTTPVIVLSARDPVENEKRALDSGAIAFFQKPPDIHEFLSAIRQALGETNALSAFLNT